MNEKAFLEHGIEDEIRHMVKRRYSAVPVFGKWQCEHHKEPGWVRWYVPAPDSYWEKGYIVQFKYCEECNRAAYNIPKGLVGAMEAIGAWARRWREEGMQWA